MGHEIYVAQMKWGMKYDEIETDPFHIFLSGGAGVGKTFLVNVISEYLKKTLVLPGQNSDEEPSIAVTASTEKPACNINVQHSISSPIIWPK